MEGNGDVTQDKYPLIRSIMTNFLQPFDELLTRLHQSANDGLVPPITCLVSDCCMPFTVDVAEEHALPILFFSPFNASTFLCIFQYPTLIRKGLVPLKGNNYDRFFLFKRNNVHESIYVIPFRAASVALRLCASSK